MRYIVTALMLMLLSGCAVYYPDNDYRYHHDRNNEYREHHYRDHDHDYHYALGGRTDSEHGRYEKTPEGQR